MNNDYGCKVTPRAIFTVKFPYKFPNLEAYNQIIEFADYPVLLQIHKPTHAITLFDCRLPSLVSLFSVGIFDNSFFCNSIGIGSFRQETKCTQEIRNKIKNL